jgi:hypothetical protein
MKRNMGGLPSHAAFCVVEEYSFRRGFGTKGTALGTKKRDDKDIST